MKLRIFNPERKPVFTIHRDNVKRARQRRRLRLIRNHADDILAAVAATAITAGTAIRFGGGLALIVGGLLLLVAVSLIARA